MKPTWMNNSWPNPKGPYGEKPAVQSLLLQCATPMDNAMRLDRWRGMWKFNTGNEPADLYTVAFCPVCNKPHWYPNAKHKHITAYCEGH